VECAMCIIDLGGIDAPGSELWTRREEQPDGWRRIWGWEL